MIPDAPRCRDAGAVPCEAMPKSASHAPQGTGPPAVTELARDMKLFDITMVGVGAMIGAALALLPPFKATLFNLQLANKAEEAQWQSTGKHGKAPKNWKG